MGNVYKLAFEFRPHICDLNDCDRVEFSHKIASCSMLPPGVREMRLFMLQAGLQDDCPAVAMLGGKGEQFYQLSQQTTQYAVHLTRKILRTCEVDL